MSKSEETEFLPAKSALGAAGGVLFAAGFFGLSFGRGALPSLAEAGFGDEVWRMRGLWWCLGLGGVGGSVLAAAKFNVYRWQRQLSWALRACALGAVLTMVATGGAMLWGAALVSGGALGALAVILATGLRATVGTRSLGKVVGWGVGLAFFGTAVMEIFEVAARTQTGLAAFLIAAVSVLSPFLAGQEPSTLHRGDYAPAGVVWWLGVLGILGLGEALLFTVSWGGGNGGSPLGLFGKGPVLMGAGQFAAAIGAGWWLDRGGRWGVVGVGFGLLALSVGFTAWSMPGGAGLAYAGGASLSVVLSLYYPARSGRAWLGCGVFVLVGAVGTAAGMGLWSPLLNVPLVTVGGGGLVLGLLGWWARQASRKAT